MIGPRNQISVAAVGDVGDEAVDIDHRRVSKVAKAPRSKGHKALPAIAGLPQGAVAQTVKDKETNSAIISAVK